MLMFLPLMLGLAVSPLRCDMSALTAEERARHKTNSVALFTSITERKELKNGYAFRVGSAPLRQVGEWIELERKCCPFFRFELDVQAERGAIWLKLTGPSGVKELIRAEIPMS